MKLIRFSICIKNLVIWLILRLFFAVDASHGFSNRNPKIKNRSMPMEFLPALRESEEEDMLVELTSDFELTRIGTPPNASQSRSVSKTAELTMGNNGLPSPCFFSSKPSMEGVLDGAVEDELP